MGRTVRGVAGLRSLLGESLGPSPWMPVDQRRIDAFADLTGDRHWIHVDRERAARESPYGRTIAHGDLVLSLLGASRAHFLEPAGFALMVNRGWRDVVFEQPVTEGSDIAATSAIAEVNPLDGGLWELVETMGLHTRERKVCSATAVTWFMES